MDTLLNYMFVVLINYKRLEYAFVVNYLWMIFFTTNNELFYTIFELKVLKWGCVRVCDQLKEISAFSNMEIWPMNIYKRVNELYIKELNGVSVHGILDEF